jgi:drug/metabolite transporter (DMT)-like permease
MKSSLPIVGFALMLIAGLLFVAGAPQFNLMPRNYANFGGLAVGSLGVLVWVIYGVKRSQSGDDESK